MPRLYFFFVHHRFDFVAMPVVHPRFKREFLEGKAKDRQGAFARSDLLLSSQGKHLVEKT